MQEKKENKFVSFIGTFLIIICIPILIVFLTIAIKAIINHEHLPDFMGYKPLICASNSMEDIFSVGDITISKEISQKELKEGDIISFWDAKNDNVIMHRINKIETDENNEQIYITKGDMNNEADPEIVEFKQIEGRYVGHIKYIGKLILLLQKPIGLIVAFLIPVIITALMYKHDIKVSKIKDARKQKLLKKIEEKEKH